MTRLRWLPALVTLLVAIPFPSPPPAQAANPATATVYTWYSPTREDYFTTSSPAWTSDTSTKQPDYRFIRNEGKVLVQPQPGTVPMYHWYNGATGDNFTTTDSRWASTTPGEARNGYSFIRVDGHLFSKALAGTYELRSFFNQGLGDNRMTSRTNLTARPLGNTDGGYRSFRTEGYLVAPTEHAEPVESFGYKSNPQLGQRPLLVLAVGYPNLALRHANSYFENVVFGSGQSVANLFRDMSGRAFGWQRLALVKVTNSQTWPWANGYNPAIEALQKADSSVNYAPLDTNGDRIVTPNELGVLLIGAGQEPSSGGQTTSPGCITTTDGQTAGKANIQVCPKVSGANEDSQLSNYAHELGHQFTPDHQYGSNCQSHYLSPMATCTSGGIPDLVDPHHIDPFQQMKWGWIQPRVVPVTTPGSTEWLGRDGAFTDWPRRPILFYNPLVGTDEFLMVEYRNPNLGGTDAAVAGQGVVVWYIQTTPDNALKLIPGAVITPGANGTLQSASPAGSDDAVLDGNVVPGPNRELETARAGDDVLLDDAALLSLGAPAALRGGSVPWTTLDGEFGLQFRVGRWFAPTGGLRLKVGPMLSGSTDIGLQWRFDRPFIPRIIGTSQDGVLPGATFGATGKFGVVTSDIAFALEGSDGREHPLSIQELTSGSEGREDLVRLKTSSSVPRGTYHVVVRSAAGEVGNGTPIKVN